MPHWSTTDYAITGKHEDISRLHSDFKRVIAIDRSTNQDSSTFYSDASWLGYIVDELLPDVKNTEIDCRGTVSSISDTVQQLDETHSVVRISTETAWSACNELFDILAEKYHVNIKFYEEEPGSIIYRTNDSEGIFFPARYVMYTEHDRNDYNDFESLKEDFESYTGIKVDTFEDMEAVADEYEKDEDLCVYQIQIV